VRLHWLRVMCPAAPAAGLPPVARLSQQVLQRLQREEREGRLLVQTGTALALAVAAELASAQRRGFVEQPQEDP
jgi:hypothetical protein